MSSKVLKIATCQFAVCRNIRRNSHVIGGFLYRAKKAGVDIVHFPECALSGYAGIDFLSFKGYDWELLKREALRLIALAGELQLWIALGSSHRLSGRNKPLNSLYLIGPKGEIIDRYDKRFCTEKEMEHFTPGNRFVVFTINGVKCSLLICFDLRFPELYRELYKQGVNCVFQSFYNARQKGRSIHTHIMRQTMQCHAATNHFWVSMSNACGVFSPYPSCFITPDGVIANQLHVNQRGLLVNTVDLKEEFYDPMAPFRDSVVGGALGNGPTRINDPRSSDKTCL